MVNLWQTETSLSTAFAVDPDGSISTDHTKEDNYAWWPTQLKIPIENTWLIRGGTYSFKSFGDWPVTQVVISFYRKDESVSASFDGTGHTLTIPQDTATVSFAVNLDGDSLPLRANAKPMLVEGEHVPDRYEPYYYPDIREIPVTIPELDGASDNPVAIPKL